MLKKTIACVVAVACLGAVELTAEPAARTVAIYDALGSLELPSDWTEMATQDLEDGTFETAEVTGGRLFEIYQHGFRSVDSPADHGLPQILVQIREVGRLRYGRFLSLPDIAELREESRTSFPTGLPPLIVGVNVENASFDRKAYAIRLEHRLNLRFRGEIDVLTTAFLTERGLVAFHYSDRPRRIEEGRVFFDRLMDTVRFDPEVAYRPRISDRWPGLPFFAAAGVTAALLVAYLMIRRRATS